MYNNKKNFEVNEDQTAAFLENAVNQVKSDLDVESLAQLAKLYKKNVPFSLRKYVTAYLLREALKHDHSFRGNRFEKNDRNNDKNRNKKNETRDNTSRDENKKAAKPVSAEATASAEERQPHPRVEIPEDQAKTIFISIGRNRRVFPRDLVSLLCNAGGLDRDRIGNIKILANYSFVQLYADDTEKVIAALNDYEYRGRKLAVNFSHPKTDAETAEVPSDENVELQMSEEEQMSAEDAAAYAAAEKAASNEPFGNN